MKTIILLSLSFIFVLAVTEGRSQIYLISDGGIVETCSGEFYDSGGPSGNYGNNDNFIMTFRPATTGAKIQFDFTSFSVEPQPQCQWDFLEIFNGENTSAPLVGKYCGTNSPGLVTSTSVSGALTFRFVSNRANAFPGWSASISCVIPPTLGLWTGAISEDWNNAGNWYHNFVPTSMTDVTIPSEAQNWPVYDGNLQLGITCNDMAMNGNSELTITGNFVISSGRTFISTASSYVRIGGDFHRSGVLHAGTGTFEFFGTASASISGSPGMWTIFRDGFENDKGWILTGEFERDMPQGLGGGPGVNNNPDPTSAYAGINVLGVDLTGLGDFPGNYEPNIGLQEYQAISPVINCTGITNVSFNFQRWLGVQNFNQDEAHIDISIDGGLTWINLWSHNSGISETEWSLQEFNISTIADGQPDVRIRFTMGPTNQNQGYCGWNIDEFIVRGNVADFVPLYNLTISKENAEVLSDAYLEVAGNLTVKPGSWLTNSTGRRLDVGGHAKFEADASGMASFIDHGLFSVDGNTTVQQHLTSERWHMVSPPITDAIINTYFDIYLKFYNEPTDTWTYLILPVTIPMNVAGGYAAWASNSLTGTKTVEFTTSGGTLNNTDYYIDTLSFTPGAPMEGFNLIGNPYISALDWNMDWSMDDMSGWMVIYDDGIYRGYHTDGSSYNGGTSVIPSTQGFWVRALSSAANITIPRSERIHSGQDFYKSGSGSVNPEIRLTSEIGGMKDETAIFFSPNASAGFDGFYDLRKFENVSEAPTLYTISDGKEYGVNYLSESFHEITIPVGFKTGEDGIYTISAPKVSGFTSNIKIYFEDRKTDNIIELSENTMIEFAYHASDDPHRFNILLKDMALGDEDLTLSEVFIYSFRNLVNIRIPAMQTGEAAVYDLMGREIIRNRINGENLNQFEVNSTPGYYLVKVSTNDHVFTQKVFIR
jgi:hypothetical protein